MIDVGKLAHRLGVTFVKKELLQQAVTHRSYLNEHRDYALDHNERLEFLGDAVLELVVTEHLYGNYSNPEGELTSWRAALVNGDMLAKVASSLGVNDFLLMSRGESKDTGRARQYLMANALEAIIGALYVDQGYDEAKAFITAHVLTHLPEVLAKKLYRDAKSYFQEVAQEKASVTPRYVVLKEWGPDHDRHFVIGVYLGDEKVAEGEGKSKQDAQREAAQAGLEAKGWI